MMAARLVSKRLEINAGLVVLLAIASLCGALWIYTHVQTSAQVRLAEAFLKAEFEGPFCDGQVSLDGTLCRESPRMSWQQIHAVLAAARVIDVTEYESCSKLEARFNDGKTRALEDLLTTLRGDQGEPTEPECPGGVDIAERGEDADESAESEDAEEPPPDGDAMQGGQPGVERGKAVTKTALGLIVRLAKKQCESIRTTNGEGSEGGLSHPERLRNDLSLALADALGDEGALGDRCEAARGALKEIGSGERRETQPSGMEVLYRAVPPGRTDPWGDWWTSTAPSAGRTVNLPGTT